MWRSTTSTAKAAKKCRYSVYIYTIFIPSTFDVIKKSQFHLQKKLGNLKVTQESRMYILDSPLMALLIPVDHLPNGIHARKEIKWFLIVQWLCHISRLKFSPGEWEKLVTLFQFKCLSSPAAWSRCWLALRRLTLLFSAMSLGWGLKETTRYESPWLTMSSLLTLQ